MFSAHAHRTAHIGMKTSFISECEPFQNQTQFASHIFDANDTHHMFIYI